MGVYTEIYFRSQVSNWAADIMKYVAETGYNSQRVLLPRDPFFDAPRFPAVFTGRSAYFPGGIDLTITPSMNDPYERYGFDSFRWSIVEFRANLKNEDNEILKFFQWIESRVRDNGFMGYSLHEEDTVPIFYSKEA